MLVWLWVAVLTVGIDQLTKYIAVSSLKYDPVTRIGETVEVIPSVLNWKLAYNPGASWSMLSDIGPWFFIGITAVVSIILLGWLYRLTREARVEAIGLSLILGGAIGNVTDRIVSMNNPEATRGVTDFIQAFPATGFPIFNIADSAITIGVVLLIVDMLFLSRHRQESS